jgi:hypothetical protein
LKVRSRFHASLGDNSNPRCHRQSCIGSCPIGSSPAWTKSQ